MKDGEGVSGGEMGLASHVNIELIVPWFSKWGPGTAAPAAPRSRQKCQLSVPTRTCCTRNSGWDQQSGF